VFIIWAPPHIEKIWITTFELEDLARLGGLGSAVRRHIDILIRRGFKIRVFMPSHGRHFSDEILRRFSLRFVENFKCCGVRKGVDGRDYPYCIGAYEGSFGEVYVTLFIGLDRETGMILDTWDIYSNLPEKVSLMIRGLKCWLQHTDERPDLLIGHDWHGGLAASFLRIMFEKEGLSIPFLYFIHLISGPSFPYHYISSEWTGFPLENIRVWRGWRHEHVNIKDLWDKYYGNTDLFNIDVADAVATVSYGYSKEIIGRVGEWAVPKTCVVYNATDWNIDDVKKFLRARYGSDDRCEIRWRLYKDMIRYANPCIGHIEPGGFLIISGGRISGQKGFDILIRSLEHLDHRFKILILGLRVGDVGYENYLRELASKYFGRILVTCNNIDKIIYQSFNYVANVVVVPSRYEPFGLASVEAQAVGTPVVLSRIPGLSETAKDVRLDPEGTAVFFTPEDPMDLAISLKSLALITEAIDCKDHSLINEIPDPLLRNIASYNIWHISKIRENCVSFVDKNFRDKNTENMLLECIEKSRVYSYYRSLI